MSRPEIGVGMYVQVLGCGAAKPSLGHNPSAQVVRLRGNKAFLIDCAEGTQLQMMRYGVPIASLHRIFITHLHGDHCLGLPGLISTMSLMSFDHPIHIYGPMGTADFVDRVVRYFTGEKGEERYAEIEVHECAPTGRTVIYEDRSVTVSCFPLKHRVPCVGYRFDEAPLLPHLDREAADRAGVPFAYFNSLKQGRDYVREDGTVVPAASVTTPSRRPLSYAYCSDTIYREATADYVRGVDLLYHEATLGEEWSELAKHRGHSTPRQAAEVARLAGAGHLLLGHFSSRYTPETEESILLAEAKEVFPRSLLAHEGQLLDLEQLREEE